MKKYSRQRDVSIELVIGTTNKKINEVENIYRIPFDKAILAMVRALKRNNMKITHKNRHLIKKVLQEKTGFCLYIWDDLIGINKSTIKTEGKSFSATYMHMCIWFSEVFDNDEYHESIEDYYGHPDNKYWIHSKEDLDYRMNRMTEMDDKDLELEFSQMIKEVKGLSHE